MKIKLVVVVVVVVVVIVVICFCIGETSLLIQTNRSLGSEITAGHRCRGEICLPKKYYESSLLHSDDRLLFRTLGQCENLGYFKILYCKKLFKRKKNLAMNKSLPS